MNSSEEKKKILERKPDTPLFYVEGIAQLSVGYPNSRLLFHRENPHKDTNGDEVHDAVCELVIPTTGLLEITQRLNAIIVKNKKELQGISQNWQDSVNKKFDEFPDPNNESD